MSLAVTSEMQTTNNGDLKVIPAPATTVDWPQSGRQSDRLFKKDDIVKVSGFLYSDEEGGVVFVIDSGRYGKNVIRLGKESDHPELTKLQGSFLSMYIKIDTYRMHLSLVHRTFITLKY